jgi:lipopolysaccharide export system protein LptC
MIARARDAWERFLLYLPLAFMVGLALATYWLVRTAPSPSAPSAQRVAGHEPDYFMESFSLKTFDAKGRIRSEILGERAQHFPDTQGLEIDGIRIRSFDDKGRLTTATANKGMMSEDASEVQLLGNAVVVREAPKGDKNAAGERLEYRSEFLHAFMTSEIVRSHKPVELKRGRDRFSADSMDYDNVEQVLQLRGRVHGTLFPGTP